jgi:hypothetical protein
MLAFSVEELLEAILLHQKQRRTSFRGAGQDREEKSVRWITENCEHVRQEMGQSSDSTVLLYDCCATELVESGNP